jgi:hypothetical protein
MITEMFSGIALLVGGIIGYNTLPTTMSNGVAAGIGALAGLLCFLAVNLIWQLAGPPSIDDAIDDYYDAIADY